MQVLVPMAGVSPFFPIGEYHFPKPLIEVDGVPMVQKVVEKLRSLGPSVRFVFVVAEEDTRKFSLDTTLRILGGESAAISRCGKRRAARSVPASWASTTSISTRPW